MITMTTLRDITLSLGALSVAAFAADELSGGRLGRSLRQRGTQADIPPARHGWLYTLDSLAGTEVRVRALRPATAAEATASANTAAAGDGGWFALDTDGTIYDVDDPAVLARAGRSWTERIDIVYVATPRHTAADYAAHLRTQARGPILRDALAQAPEPDDITDPWDLTDVVPVAGVDTLLDEADALVQGELEDPANGTDTRLR